MNAYLSFHFVRVLSLRQMDYRKILSRNYEEIEKKSREKAAEL